MMLQMYEHQEKDLMRNKYPLIRKLNNFGAFVDIIYKFINSFPITQHCILWGIIVFLHTRWWDGVARYWSSRIILTSWYHNSIYLLPVPAYCHLASTWSLLETSTKGQCSGNGFVTWWHQAITWTNVDTINKVHWHLFQYNFTGDISAINH